MMQGNQVDEQKVGRYNLSVYVKKLAARPLRDLLVVLFTIKNLRYCFYV
jgi:hypothetical protein